MLVTVHRKMCRPTRLLFHTPTWCFQVQNLSVSRHIETGKSFKKWAVAGYAAYPACNSYISTLTSVIKKGEESMKLSLSTFVYFRYPLVEAIKRMAAFGYDGVEIWGGRPHAYCDDMDDAHVKETRKVLDDTGIAISNFIPAQFRYPSNPAAPDEKIRTGSVDYLKKSMDAAAALGSPYVSLCPGFSMYGQTVEEGWDAMIGSFNQLLAHARGMDLTLILEPANRMESDLVVTVDDGLKAVREVDGEMGLLVDIGHLFVNKEPLADAIAKVQSYPHHFHIDDNNGN